jgi:ABC-type multidrug transport system fused ATPase/permease subunit
MADIQSGISEKVALTLTGVSTFVAALAVGFVKEWKLTLILFSIIVALFVSMCSFSRLILKFKTESMQYSSIGASLAEEIFSSIRVQIEGCHRLDARGDDVHYMLQLCIVFLAKFEAFSGKCPFALDFI